MAKRKEMFPDTEAYSFLLCIKMVRVAQVPDFVVEARPLEHSLLLQFVPSPLKTLAKV